MFGSQILDVGIGVVLVFLLTSTLCTVIREGMDAWLKTRAAFLEYGIREMLHDKPAQGLAKSFFNHPLIFGLFAEEYKPGSATRRPSALTQGGTLPSYIPARSFALALMDIIARGPVSAADASAAPAITPALLRANSGNLQNPAVQRVLLLALDATQEGDLPQVQAHLEAWYNGVMDRISGWYKRSTQWVIFWIALVVSAAVNINTITITDYLSRNDVARAALVARAQAAVRDSTAATHAYYTAKSELDSLALPIGWAQGWGAPRQHMRASGQPDSLTPKPDAKGYRQPVQAPGQPLAYWNDLLAPVVGWLITALAAMLGAPFWFDVLNKIMIIRSTVKPQEKSPEAADRQAPQAPSRLAPLPGPGGAPAYPAAPPAYLAYPAGAPAYPAAPPPAADELDGCDVQAQYLTADEDLPAAQGGIALA